MSTRTFVNIMVDRRDLELDHWLSATRITGELDPNDLDRVVFRVPVWATNDMPMKKELVNRLVDDFLSRVPFNERARLGLNLSEGSFGVAGDVNSSRIYPKYIALGLLD